MFVNMRYKRTRGDSKEHEMQQQGFSTQRLNRAQLPELFTTSTSNTTKMTSDDKEKANILAKFFSSVYKKEPNWTWEMNKDEKPEINHE